MFILVKEFLKILLNVLKNEIKFFLIRLINNFFEADDVRVWLELFKDTNFSHSSGGNSFILIL